MNQERRQHLASTKTVVLKFGTQLLGDARGRLDVEYLSNVANQVVELRQRGIAVTIVSSGAIGAGVAELGLPGRPTDLAKLQAVAAVGQRRLMDGWAMAFAPHGVHVAQMLLTRHDIDDRTRFLNLRNTVHAAHELSAVPIINENDTVSTDEIIAISFGDNDILAAMVAHALSAHLLVLMSVVDGLLDQHQQPVRTVANILDAAALVRDEKTTSGKGGMSSKLNAAKMVTDAGDTMAVVDGRMHRVLLRLLDCEDVGTLFLPSARRRSSRDRWMGAARPVGSILVDSGAVRALVEQHRSLLPAGITGVEGDFQRGDLVTIRGVDGKQIARGLSNYRAEQILAIKGKKTDEVRRLLQESAYDEVVHCDNLVID
jgi:glutamate 5-kinase